MSDDQDDVPRRRVAPSVRETSFNCPHCGTLTTQTWHSLVAARNSEDSRLPHIIGRNEEPPWKDDQDLSSDLRADLDAGFARQKEGRVSLGLERQLYKQPVVENLNISSCYNCGEISVWLHEQLVHPLRGTAPPPNLDMPADVLRDYREADRVLVVSPRGAAALLRLAIQKLCVALGKPGQNLNKDIGSLVEAGLSKKVQRALDAVRVIGNESVHPGQIDMRDDRATAESLFSLVNVIVRIMISENREIDEMYDKIPADKRKAIEDRDKQGP